MMGDHVFSDRRKFSPIQYCQKFGMLEDSSLNIYSSEPWIHIARERRGMKIFDMKPIGDVQ